MELALIGLQNAGKTSLVSVLTTGKFVDEIPTVGFNMRKVTKGGVVIKLWDLGGQVGGAEQLGGWLASAVALSARAGTAAALHLLTSPLAAAAAAAAARSPCRLSLPPPSPLRPLQTRFRSMWERYCRGVQAIVFVVDSADLDSLEAAKEELHTLLAKPSLVGGRVFVFLIQLKTMLGRLLHPPCAIPFRWLLLQ